MPEKRTNERFKVIKSAVLYTADDRSFQCLVTDLSVGGARLSLAGHETSVAAAIALLMADECLLYPCKIRWHIDGLVGVTFTGQPELTGPPADEIRQAQYDAEQVRQPDQ